ncbi:MAG: flagellar biosynthetic protein FliO [Oscillospiraceae bacterium]|jgi:flagellar biogenesis protein FliO|nr:flagellar biosynthetic protein FliO [Oscillospiraceae bacterium]
MEPVQVVIFIIGTILIIVAAYYVTYFVGSKASGTGRGRAKNRNINLLDRFAISKDKSFCIVEIAGKIYVIGVTNQSMTLIDTLDAATFAENAEERGGSAYWQAPGGKYTSRMTGRLAAFMSGRMNKKRDAASFSETMRNAQKKDAGSTDENDDSDQ